MKLDKTPEIEKLFQLGIDRMIDMKTSIKLDAALVDELVQTSGEKSAAAAVRKAVQEYLRRARINEFRKRRGKIGFDEEAIEAVEKADRERAEFLDGLRNKRRK